MAIVNSCCCWLSLKVGSFICGFYTMIYYSLMLIVEFYQVDTWDHSLGNETNLMYNLGHYADDSYPLMIAVVTSSGITALTSIILLIGIFLENRLLLLPWIFSLLFATFIAFIFTVFVLGMAVIHPYFPIMAAIDFFVCLLNMYCAVVVIGLYQEYKCRRSRNGHDNLQYEKENSSCDVNKRSMTLTESDRNSSRDPNLGQRRCSSPHPAFYVASCRRSSAGSGNQRRTTTVEAIPRCTDSTKTEVEDEHQAYLHSCDAQRTDLNVLEVVNAVSNGGERRRSSTTNTKHVQFHLAIEESPATEDISHSQMAICDKNGKS